MGEGFPRAIDLKQEQEPAGPAPNHTAMLLRLTGISEPDLERQLLRRGVGELMASRPACADCGRTPLVGERYHRYARGAVVCELCRPGHEGAPHTSDVVRHSERGHAVRLRARPAA